MQIEVSLMTWDSIVYTIHNIQLINLGQYRTNHILCKIQQGHPDFFLEEPKKIRKKLREPSLDSSSSRRGNNKHRASWGHHDFFVQTLCLSQRKNSDQLVI